VALRLTIGFSGSLEQGLLTKPLALEDIYYRTTLDT
jgi:hypothetical protein